MRILRAFTGLLAGGLVVLTLVVIGSAVFGDDHGLAGPGGVSIGGHVIAAIVAVAAQIYADRKRGLAAFVACLVVLVTTGLLFWTQWWG
ncbi:hypothetical protein OG921_11180 [Aldersonia sp. NBC_00410]|jgi:hypothetical protein|uniref:hypothetical protein n=1 Tax=Aldersonia sp. NBC_00410 TaxID=2975954 RepID=UPI00225B6271|nr:hypothetical protein [Aldersonia sp. NBC_00410]MCX5043728.1 hypothetical protein [Aldersonia sp. NBC_00410]